MWGDRAGPFAANELAVYERDGVVTVPDLLSPD